MNITKFNKPIFGDLTVIIDMDNDPWFIGNEVGAMLGLVNARDAVNRYVSEQDKKPLKQLMAEFPTSSSSTLELNQRLTVINEAGMYDLILSSQAPKGKPFQRWITHEVLPNIRKHGSYSLTEQPRTSAEWLLEQAKALVEQEKQTKQAIETANDAHRRIDELERNFIPAGYAIVSGLGIHYGLSNQKAKELVEAYDVPTRPITVNSGTFPVLTKMVLIEDFKAALKKEIQLLSLSDTGLWFAGGQLGRFAAKGRVLELFKKYQETLAVI
ncbi:TPA: hypothetical protein O4G41_000909 [Vibrio alginolyticus]|uniref:BRO-N domain-containing protein n=1 Tax=Vibrio parahaemolyticus TaxID=670 RepID=UPI0011213170|nr:BRO family protein [Vibrio parahaemolyticus]TOA43673.1 hypothetical protein CGK26_22980 [Vibrio parahaemolyticus]HCZ9044746.1 hypothetical protein [Vibrio alginolyticus]HCZ9299189.1 hypothetical protein [Vibrio alginolyticus]